jgi:hypothetical protein
MLRVACSFSTVGTEAGREGEIVIPFVTTPKYGKISLRILKLIRSSSSGVLGSRNYLKMIYSRHTGKGKWAALFQKYESIG